MFDNELDEDQQEMQMNLYGHDLEDEDQMELMQNFDPMIDHEG